METLRVILVVVGFVCIVVGVVLFIAWHLDTLGNIKSRVENIDNRQDDLLNDMEKIKKILRTKDDN